MKKILTFLMILCCLPAFCFSKTYTVETSKGLQEVIIPEGYTELDVLLVLAKNYYELSWEHDKLIAEVEDYNTQIAEYIAQNKSLRDNYNDLLNDYSELSSKLSKLNMTAIINGVVGGAITFEDQFTILKPAISVGVLFGEKIMLQGTVMYPWSITATVSYIF